MNAQLQFFGTFFVKVDFTVFTYVTVVVDSFNGDDLSLNVNALPLNICSYMLLFFEVFSHYHKSDSSIWRQKENQLTISETLIEYLFLIDSTTFRVFF